MWIGYTKLDRKNRVMLNGAVKDMTERREQRSFSDKFKNQMVQLYNISKPRAEIIRVYDLSSTAFNRWTKRINSTGSTKESANRTPDEQELLRLRKENQRLKMENDG